MTDTLSNKEIEQLIDCGKAIQEDLMCDANGTGLPCRTDRLSAVESMKEYLEIHGYKIIDNNIVNLFSIFIGSTSSIFLINFII